MLWTDNGGRFLPPPPPCLAGVASQEHLVDHYVRQEAGLDGPPWSDPAGLFFGSSPRPFCLIPSESVHLTREEDCRLPVFVVTYAFGCDVKQEAELGGLSRSLPAGLLVGS